MEINWDAVGAIAEIVGVIGVVLSVVYLAIEVRSNTNATRAAAGFDAAHSWASFNEGAIDLDPKLKAEVARAYAPDACWTDFSTEIRSDIALLHRALFQRLEGQYILHQYAFLDDGIWESRRLWAAGLIALPFFTEWWKQEKAQNVYSSNFVAAVEAVAAGQLDFVGVRDSSS